MSDKKTSAKALELLAELAPELNAHLNTKREARPRVVKMCEAYREPQRRHLNMLVFPDRLYLEGLSLSTLLSMPQQELVGVIPDYREFREGDVLTALVHHRKVHRTAVVGSYAVRKDDKPITVHYSREALERFGVNGRMDFSYEVRNETGDMVVRSPATPLFVSLHDLPERLAPPVIVSVDPSAVRDGDITPHLLIEIPAAPGLSDCNGEIRLRLGDACSMPRAFSKADTRLDPMNRLIVSRDDVMQIAGEERINPFEIEIAYDILAHGVVSASEAALVRFDLKRPAPAKRAQSTAGTGAGLDAAACNGGLSS